MAQWIEDLAAAASENLLNRHGRELQGIFLVNETSTGGMLLALQDAGLAGKVKLVGFDGTPALVAAMRAAGIRAHLDDRSDTLNYRIREAETMKTPEPIIDPATSMVESSSPRP